MAVLLVITLTSATSVSNKVETGLAQVAELRHLVESVNACALPGVTIKYDTFIPCMWRAVALGYVRHDHAKFVHDGCTNGFRCGVDVSRMQGHRWFKNYQSALDARDAVTRATMKRVDSGKTLLLGDWNCNLASRIRAYFPSTAIFAMGAVKKALESTEMRPTSDHTRSGLNAATILDFLRHGLDTYNEVAWFLKQDYFMRVSDVDAAFPMLPLHPELWPYFMFRFYSSPEADAMSLFMHVCADFGAAGLPGTFKIFFVDVVQGMARSANVLTKPLPTYVDDCGLIGENREELDAEMVAFHEWAWDVCGVLFKYLKDRLASQHQLMIGFWWDSRTLTRTLEEKKLLAYVNMLGEYASRPSLTLREMQSIAGRMQRAIMTFPPGAACLLTSVFSLSMGLRLPWHARRTTRRVRADFGLVQKLLQMNLGRGYYSYANFRRAPEVQSDASKSQGYTGGGWVSACGCYDLWTYGSRAARKAIDFLEGDVVTACTRSMAHKWRQCVVPFGVDNMAFQRSAAKGRSSVNRLNDLVRELFALMLYFHFIFDFYWLSSADNFLADALSRKDGEEKFLHDVYASGFWAPTLEPQRLSTEKLPVRRLPETRGDVPLDGVAPPPRPTRGGKGKLKASLMVSVIVACSMPTTTSASRLSPLPMHTPMGMCVVMACALPHTSFAMPATHGLTAQQASISYGRSSIYMGLPATLHSFVERVMDNRLSSSSWRTMRSGVKIWREVAASYGWSAIIPTDDPSRGGKLIAFVHAMTENTALVWSSIQNYVWGMRNWQIIQHQADPIFGVMHWDAFMASIKVLTWVPHEPRKRASISMVTKILDDVDITSFVDVQFAFFILALLFTFSRTECPCPKTFSGRQKYDPEEHWNVRDFDPGSIEAKDGSTLRVMWVRFRAIKQDPRVERPEARGDGDWAMIGDISESKFSIFYWYTLLMSMSAFNRDPTAPFFLDPDRKRPLIYDKAMDQFKERQRRVGVAEEDIVGLHGARVEGYNATEAVLGEDVAAAHGLWKPSSHKRYKRFNLERIALIPAAVAGYLEPPEPTDERDAAPPSSRLRRADLASPSNSGGTSTALVSASEGALPDGWGYENGMYRSSDGQVSRSLRGAWQLACEHEEMGGECNAAASLAVLSGAPRGDVERAIAPNRLLAPASTASTRPVRTHRARASVNV